MNTLKTNLLLVVFGLSVAACLAEEPTKADDVQIQPSTSGDSSVQVAGASTPVAGSAVPSASETPKPCDAACIEQLRRTVEVMENNPGIKATLAVGRGIESVETHAAQAWEKGKSIAKDADEMYRARLADPKLAYQTVGATVGVALLGTALGIATLAAIAEEIRERRYRAAWKKYDEDCARQQEERQRMEDEKNRAWVQQKREEEVAAEKAKEQYAPSYAKQQCYYVSYGY